MKAIKFLIIALLFLSCNNVASQKTENNKNSEKEFNQFYHDFSILKEENSQIRNFRLQLCKAVAMILKNAMGLLGIELPEKM